MKKLKKAQGPVNRKEVKEAFTESFNNKQAIYQRLLIGSITATVALILAAVVAGLLNSPAFWGIGIATISLLCISFVFAFLCGLEDERELSRISRRRG